MSHAVRSLYAARFTGGRGYVSMSRRSSIALCVIADPPILYRLVSLAPARGPARLFYRPADTSMVIYTVYANRPAISPSPRTSAGGSVQQDVPVRGRAGPAAAWFLARPTVSSSTHGHAPVGGGSARSASRRGTTLASRRLRTEGARALHPRVPSAVDVCAHTGPGHRLVELVAAIVPIPPDRADRIGDRRLEAPAHCLGVEVLQLVQRSSFRVGGPLPGSGSPARPARSSCG